VDHIVPFRMCKTYEDGRDPNNLRNLICLCRSCHAKKTHMERKVLGGDVMGFISRAKAIVDLDRLLDALDYWGLVRLRQAPIDFECHMDSHNAGGKPCPPKPEAASEARV
jgi:hypothetical protein